MNNDNIITAYRQWLESYQWNLFLTLNYRYKKSYETAKIDISKIIKTARSFNYAIEQYNYFGFIVNSPYKINHVHYVINFLPYMGKKKLKYIIDNLKISNIVSCNLIEIYDIKGLSSYMTKNWNFSYGELITNMKEGM